MHSPCAHPLHARVSAHSLTVLPSALAWVPACVACGSQYVEPTLSGRTRGGLHDVGQEHHILTRSEVIDVHRGSLRPGPG